MEAEKLGLDPEEFCTKQNKYHNEKTDVDDITFDSLKEAEFYGKLKLAQQAGEVLKFETQVKYRLQDGFDDKEGNHHRPINYFADFKVWWTNGLIEVIDTKGCRADVYKIKKKLLLKKYPNINFREE